MERKGCYYELIVEARSKIASLVIEQITSLPESIMIIGTSGLSKQAAKAKSAVDSKVRTKRSSVITLTLAMFKLDDLSLIASLGTIKSFRIRGVLDPEWMVSLRAVHFSIVQQLIGALSSVPGEELPDDSEYESSDSESRSETSSVEAE